MTEYCGPKTSINDFDASRWRDVMSNLFGNGVFKTGHIQGAAANDLAATATGGYNWSMNTGGACIKGFLYANSATAVTGAVATAHATLDRIDTLVLNWQYASGVPTCTAIVVTGTPAASPVAPTLTQTDTQWQLPIADFLVPHSPSAQITTVTDRRVYCQATLGQTIGNATGNIPLSNGVKNVNLNADLLDGLTSGHSTGQIPVADGTVVATLNADQVDGAHAGNAGGNVALANGTVVSTLNADQVDGAHAGNASGNVALANGTVVTNLNADKLDGIDSTGFVQPGTGNEASLPIQIIVTDVLPSAGTKGRIAFVTPFVMP